MQKSAFHMQKYPYVYHWSQANDSRWCQPVQISPGWGKGRGRATLLPTSTEDPECFSIKRHLGLWCFEWFCLQTVWLMRCFTKNTLGKGSNWRVHHRRQDSTGHGERRKCFMQAAALRKLHQVFWRYWLLYASGVSVSQQMNTSIDYHKVAKPDGNL